MFRRFKPSRQQTGFVRKLDFESLEPHQQLFLVRPFNRDGSPDIIVVNFVQYNKSDNKVSYYSPVSGDKKLNKHLAELRMYDNMNEAAKGLYDVCLKREIDLPDDYKELFKHSQIESPHFWI